MSSHVRMLPADSEPVPNQRYWQDIRMSSMGMKAGRGLRPPEVFFFQSKDGSPMGVCGPLKGSSANGSFVTWLTVALDAS